MMLLALLVEGLAATLGVEAIDAGTSRKTDESSGRVARLFARDSRTGSQSRRSLGAGEFETFAVAFYHSAVNYTNLGYGDLVMSEHWRLLGPQEAVSGTLPFGWSTAAIVTIVIRLFRYRHLAPIRRKVAGVRRKFANASPTLNRTKHLRLALRLLSPAVVREHARDL